jgi:hypothetical protein
MGRHQKKTHLEITRQRYKKADRNKKSLILEEFCETYGYHRKYAIRVLNKKLSRRPPKIREGRPRYDKLNLLGPLKAIWLATNQMCSKKLKAALLEWLPHYEQEQGLLAGSLRGQLYSLSAATIDRWLAPYKDENRPHKGLSGTKPGTLLKNQIPIKVDHWDVTKPGFLEADTVAHCGHSLVGNFIWSITYTDIFSAWTENRAIWNKGSDGVVTQTQDVETDLPFKLLGFDCDNGAEFLNAHLYRYFTKRPRKPVQFTRSRPYHKNDNAHVEQKNWTHVRQLLGYERFEKKRLVDLMNDLYKNEWNLYQNHFRPTMKLIEKQKVNSRYKKKYDLPKTPYQRLLDSPDVPQKKKKELREKHKTLNPFALKREIDKKVRYILQIVRLPSQ